MELSSSGSQQQQQQNASPPSAMQQALQSFQASADAQTLQPLDVASPTSEAAPSPIESVSTAQMMQSQQPQQLNHEQLQLLQQQFLPMLAASAGVPSGIPVSGTVQQQMMWQQALQSLAAVPSFATAAAQPQQQQQQQSFLTPMTFPPHNLMFNNPLMQGQGQPQPMALPLVPSMQTQTTTSASATNTNNNKRTNISNNADNGENKKKRSREQHQKQREGGPSVVSWNESRSSQQDNNCQMDAMDNLKPPTEKSEAELEQMNPSERRRYERNLREQQRSYRISQQIKQLRDVLVHSNVPFRPNKYSILVSVAEYIQQLQGRAVMLDSEHQRLIDTIRNTHESLANANHAAGNFHGNNITQSSNDDDEEDSQDNSNGLLVTKPAAKPCPDSLLVHGIDYSAVFQHCPYPLGVATLDGRVLSCNSEFEMLLNAKTGQSFFVYIRNHQEIFEAMAALLKQSTESFEQMGANNGRATTNDTAEKDLLFWCGHIVSSRNEKIPFTITLANTADNNPKYFSLSASSVS